MTNAIIEKILQNNDKYIIFYVDSCPYCRGALDLLRSHNVRYKGYNIDNINGGMEYVLNSLNEYRDLINFDPSHRTKPIIFNNGKFLGGMSELKQYLMNNNVPPRQHF